MPSLQGFFEKYGINSTDCATALIGFKAVTYLSWTGTLLFCYRFRPLRFLMSRPSPKRMLDKFIQRYPSQYKRASNFIQRESERMGESKYFKWVPEKLGLQSKRFALSIGENIVFYKMICPILLPVQFWFIVSLLKKKNKQTTIFDVVEGVTDIGELSVRKGKYVSLDPMVFSSDRSENSGDSDVSDDEYKDLGFPKLIRSM